MKWVRLRPWLVAVALALVAIGMTAGVAGAETINECVRRVTQEIGEAMQDANFLERIALGVLWEVLVASCFFA